jgi:hypothetical protein
LREEGKNRFLDGVGDLRCANVTKNGLTSLGMTIVWECGGLAGEIGLLGAANLDVPFPLPQERGHGMPCPYEL